MYICPNCKSQIIPLKLSVSLSQCPNCGHRWVSVASNKMQENDIKVVMDSINHYTYTMDKSKNPNFSFPFYVLNNNFVKNKDTEKERNRVFNKNKTTSSIAKLNNNDRSFKSRDLIKNKSSSNLYSYTSEKKNLDRDDISGKIWEEHKRETGNSNKYINQNNITEEYNLSKDYKNLQVDTGDISLKYENSTFSSDRYNENISSINMDTHKEMVEKKTYPLSPSLNNKKSYDKNTNAYLKESENNNKDLQNSYTSNSYKSGNIGKNTIEDIKDIASKYENTASKDRGYTLEKSKNSSLSAQNPKKEVISKTIIDNYFEDVDKLDESPAALKHTKMKEEPYKSNFQPDASKSNSYKKLQEELASLEGKKSNEKNELDDIFDKISSKPKEKIKELDLDDGSIDGIGNINFGFNSSKSKLSQALGFKKSSNSMNFKENDKLKKLSSSKTSLIDSIISEEFDFIEKYQAEKQGKFIEVSPALEEFEKDLDFDLDLGNQLNHYYEDYSKKKRFDTKNIKLDKNFFKNIKKTKRFSYANLISQLQEMFLLENGYKPLISFTIYLSLIALSIFGLNYFNPNEKIHLKTKENNIIKEIPATDDISEQDFMKQQDQLHLSNSVPLNINESVSQKSNIIEEEQRIDNKKSVVVEADDVLTSLLELKPKEQNKSLKELNQQVEPDFSFSAKLNETFLKFKNFKNNLISDVKIISSNISIKESQNVNNLQLQVVIANTSSLRMYFIGNLLVEFVDDKGNTLATRTLKVNRSLSLKETISLKIEFPDLSIRVKKAYVSIL